MGPTRQFSMGEVAMAYPFAWPVQPFVHEGYLDRTTIPDGAYVLSHIGLQTVSGASIITMAITITITRMPRVF
ncbi:hypothetical protein CCUS01_16487 [Colletotrichum cuscutae]|uniref:Uncharacterized protein n=1 Tax=Colletotrichum cuscutae TaxID=1209917 RepID=A0AAI9VBK8_9PEZI|nr:hypothetical protein CCUS01_16487 [Colletotrichum cuscutae]